MIFLFITLFLTLSISAFCSTLEAMVFSTTPVEIEALKKKNPRKGALLERFVTQIEETSSAILALNTIANTFGATLSGVLFAAVFGSGFWSKYAFPAALTIAILVFSEVLPKNMGVFYRPFVQNWLIYPLLWIRTAMSPISKFFRFFIGIIASKRGDTNQAASDDEIMLLAEKGAKDGLLSVEEKNLIQNTLTLDDVEISEIMTPRTVVRALDEESTIAEVFSDGKTIPFGRMPVYKEVLDNITGIVRRRDLLTAKAQDKDKMKISELKQPVLFVPENGSALGTLVQFIKTHQHIGIVVDEFESFTGVVTMEDIFERLLGSEIFESDDIAVDMRELARRKQYALTKKNAMQAQKS